MTPDFDSRELVEYARTKSEKVRTDPRAFWCNEHFEIVIATEHGLDFDALQMRIHPAASRIRMLAGSTPASFVAFDLLVALDRLASLRVDELPFDPVSGHTVQRMEADPGRRTAGRIQGHRAGDER